MMTLMEATVNDSARIRTLLHDHPWIDSGEIAQVLGLARSGVSARLADMRRRNLVESRQVAPYNSTSGVYLVWALFGTPGGPEEYVPERRRVVTSRAQVDEVINALKLIRDDVDRLLERLGVEEVVR